VRTGRRGGCRDRVGREALGGRGSLLSRVVPLPAICLEGLVAGVVAVLPDVDAVSLRKARRQTQSLITRGRAQLDDAGASRNRVPERDRHAGALYSLDRQSRAVAGVGPSQEPWFLSFRKSAM
jgi:hypothetical protein